MQLRILKQILPRLSTPTRSLTLPLDYYLTTNRYFTNGSGTESTLERKSLLLARALSIPYLSNSRGVCGQRWQLYKRCEPILVLHYHRI
ncbi:unnamed protein product [Caenorhabditis brenneri]